MTVEEKTGYSLEDANKYYAYWRDNYKCGYGCSQHKEETYLRWDDILNTFVMECPHCGYIEQTIPQVIDVAKRFWDENHES